MRVDVARIDAMVNLVGELAITKMKLSERSRRHAGDPLLMDAVSELERLTHRLQSDALSTRLIPLDYVFHRFTRLVRDLSRQQDKQVMLEIEGQTIELDRSILNGITEPLIHVIRNAIDHGIEPAEARVKAGKGPVARLAVSARRERTDCVVVVADDGRGVDIASVLERAGVPVPADQAAAMRLACDAIFAPGLSTVERVTELSGRGKGLAAVRQRIETLGGQIDVKSQPGAGTAFEFRLPMSMAIIQALLVETNCGRYAIPINRVADNVVVPRSRVEKVGGQPVIDHRGRVTPLRSLDTLLEPGRGLAWLEDAAPDQRFNVVILKDAGAVGLVVDHLLGKHEIVVKPLGRLMGRTTCFSGATILEDGAAAFILDVNGLEERSRHPLEPTT